MQFIYYGDKGEAPVPETFVDREKVVSHYMSVLTFSLVYDVVNFEKIPRLVYEPILPAYSYPAGEDDIVPDQQLCEDRNEPAKPLPAAFDTQIFPFRNRPFPPCRSDLIPEIAPARLNHIRGKPH